MGLKMSSRGQGHGFCARRPRIGSHPSFPTLKGSNPSTDGPHQAATFLAHRSRGLDPQATLMACEERTVSALRDPAAFPSNSRPFARRQQYTVNGQSATRAHRRGHHTPRVVVHTRPRPALGAFDRARSHGVEANAFHFIIRAIPHAQAAESLKNETLRYPLFGQPARAYFWASASSRIQIFRKRTGWLWSCSFRGNLVGVCL